MKFFLKECDVTCSWTPPPVTNCYTFSDPVLERDVLYGRPLQSLIHSLTPIVSLLNDSLIIY